MKRVYFIRHGQSTGNVSLIRQQVGTTVLTQTGLDQARTMAAHMSKFPLKAIIASPFARAKSTAQELSRVTNLSIIFNELFVERRRPGVQLRKRKTHPHWVWVQLQLMLFSHYSWYKHSDEETPEELLLRARKALEFIQSRPETDIAVVTHGRFMRALCASMTLGEGVTGRAYLQATRRLRVRNTALMVATFNEGEWKVEAWNVDASTV